MGNIRPIRQEELEIVHFMLRHAGLNPADYPVSPEVDEYENGKMGSISLGGNVNAYKGDIVQAEYVDIDNTPVVISLTVDDYGHLLDLDFWKVDFSKLLEYPTPDQLIFGKTPQT